jgi:hypothetical protein
MQRRAVMLFLALFFSCARAQDTGIFVGEPKIYDDRSLQLMLNATRAQLNALHPLDQATLIGHIGAVQGANLRQSSFALQVNGPPSVGNVTTTSSGTASPVQTSDISTTTGTTASKTVENKTVTTTPSATTQNVATQPSVAPSAPSAPAPTTSLPSTYGISALDTLNEEMQLAYETANLQLLLEGSISDRFVSGTHLLKRHTTVGFPISIGPSAEKRFRNAVAEVEVVVTNGPGILQPGQAPALLTILPREKTYNVANITDRSASIGGGVVAQVVSVGATWMWGHKTYYLAQDQDTVALQRPAPAGQTKFAWQFRPVLGQKVLRSGLRQTFVQLAFGTGPSRPGCLGFAQITTRWRKYDPKTGTVGDEIMASSPQSYRLANFDLTPQADSVNVEDVGGGSITVTLTGGFLPGTRVRIGGLMLDESMPNVTLSPNALQFTVPANIVAKNSPMLVGRDGTEHEALQPDPAVGNNVPELPDCTDQLHAPVPGAAVTPPPPIKPAIAISDVSVTPYTDTQSLVTVTLSSFPSDPGGLNPLVVLLGGTLFGLSDSPFIPASAGTLRFISSNDLIRTNRTLTVKRLFWGRNFAAGATLTAPSDYSIAKVNLLTTGDDTVFAVSGIGANQLQVIVPERGTRTEQIVLPGGAANDTTAILLHVPSAELKGLKQFAMRVGTQPVIFLPVPDGAKEPSPKAMLKPHAPIPPGTGVSLTIGGTALDSIRSIRYIRTPLSFRLSLDKQSLIVDLPPEITSTEGVRFLDFLYSDGTSARYEIDVKSKK